MEQRKKIVEDKMKNALKNSIKFIDLNISWSGYETKMPIKYEDIKYTEYRSIYFFIRQFNANFGGDEALTNYFNDNYVTLANYLVALGNK